ncbi:MAG: type III pantothenate kinase [Saprospiraceae bacterium]|nr:type III pantothenate kinase [Saprospiraceae bacterium]MBK9565489.1 type III pantothenate kinase [Saprospiraceae bacterium]MBP6448505.1 type III pantothenate kinase [Saprospiraceae bacterium]
MIVAIDIGNTNIVIAMYRHGIWTNSYRYETKEPQPEFFYEQAFRNILLEWQVTGSEIHHCVISSVVPDINHVIIETVESVTGYSPLLLQPEIYKNLDINVPHPYEIGSDIVSNAYAALKLFGTDCIIVDFGTALTFTVAHYHEGISGVTIAPGLKTAIHSLATNTAQLPVVPLELPESAIGHDTVSAIQSGVLWGYVGLVKQILHKIKSESNKNYKVIATGGLSSILHPLESEFDVVSKMLTLDGMRLIYQQCKGVSID